MTEVQLTAALLYTDLYYQTPGQANEIPDYSALYFALLFQGHIHRSVMV